MALAAKFSHWWSLNGVATDEVGGATLTLNNSPATGTGLVYASAYDLELDSTQFLSRASQASLQLGDTTKSYVAWFKAESFVNSFHTVLGKDDEAAGASEYVIYAKNDGSGNYNIQWAVFDAAGSTIASITLTGTNLATGTWYMVAVGHNHTTNEIWASLNAAAKTTAATGGTAPAAGGAQLRIGAIEFSGAERYFDGLVGPAGIATEELTADDLTSLYNAGAGRAYPFTTATPFHLLLLGAG